MKRDLVLHQWPRGMASAAPGVGHPGRVAVVVIAPDALTLGVYALTASGRVRAHVRRAVALTDAKWPAVRDALRPLVALARARGSSDVAIMLRASVRGLPWTRGAAEEARRLRSHLLRLSAEDELRFLFLGGIREVPAHDGVIAELEPFGIALARFRGRVLAATARIRLGDPPARSGLALGGAGGALVVSGSLVKDARARGTSAAALKRLKSWTGSKTAVVSRDALAVGLAAALLRAPIPDVYRANRS